MNVMCMLLLALGADGAEAVRALPELVGISISPVTELSAVRFVHRTGDGRAFVDLGQASRHDELQTIMLQRFGSWNNIPGGLTGPFDESATAALCDQFGVKPTERYVVVLPFEDRAVTVETSGLVIFYEGGGPSFALGHLVDVNAEGADPAVVAVGVAYPSEHDPEFNSKPVGKVAPEEWVAVASTLAAVAKSPDLQILDGVAIADSPVRLIVARIDASDYLYWVRLTDEGYVVTSLADFWKNEGFILEDRPGKFCGAMHDSRVALLPDLNGDGTPELFIRSDFSYLLDPAKAPATEFGRAYFGP